MFPGTPLDYNLSKEEWLAMRDLAEDRNIIIKPADKGSCVVVCYRENFIVEADRQLKDNEIYQSSSFQYVDLVKLVEKSNSILQSLRKRKLITEKELKYTLINIRGPPISEKCTYCLRSISV